MAPRQGPHQLFHSDVWGGFRQALPPLGDPGAIGGTGIGRAVADSRHVDPETKNPVHNNNHCEGSSGAFSPQQQQQQQQDDLADNNDEQPMCFSDLEGALDDDDDCEEACRLDSSGWHRRDGLVPRHSGVEIFVGGLTRSTRRDMLRDWFQHAGDVTEVRIARDKRRRRCRGYGYVRFATSEQANRAIETMHRFEFKPGRFLGVLPSDENRTLFVGGLKEEWSCEHICKLLEGQMPGLLKVEPIPDREDRGKIRTFCFLEFASHPEAALVLNRHQVETSATNGGSTERPGGNGEEGMLSVTNAVNSAGTSTAAFEREARVSSISSCPESSCEVVASFAMLPGQGIVRGDGAASATCGDGASSGSCASTPAPARTAAASEPASATTDHFLYDEGNPLDFEGAGDGSGIGGNSSLQDAGVVDSSRQQSLGIHNDTTGGSGETYGKERRLSAVSEQDHGRETVFSWGKDASVCPPACSTGGQRAGGGSGGGVPLVVGGTVLKVDWADPLRYHIHLNGGIKGPCAVQEVGMIESRPIRQGTHPRGRPTTLVPGRGVPGTLEWLNRHHPPNAHMGGPSPNWQEASGDGGLGGGYRNSLGGRICQQYSRYHNTHQYPQQRAVGGSPTCHHGQLSYPNSFVSSGTRERERGHAVVDPPSAVTMLSPSMRTRSYHDPLSPSISEQGPSESSANGGSGRGRADSFAGLPSVGSSQGCPAYLQPENRSSGGGVGVGLQQQNEDSGARHGCVQPRFRPHPPGHLTADLRPSPASESLDPHRYRALELDVGAGGDGGGCDRRRVTGASSGVAARELNVGSYGSVSPNNGVHSLSHHHNGGSGGRGHRVLPHSWSVTSPQRGRDTQERWQQCIQTTDSGSWGREQALVSRAQPWPAAMAKVHVGNNRRTGGQSDDDEGASSRWMDRGGRAERRETTTSEALGARSVYDACSHPPSSHQMDAMEPFPRHGSRVPTGLVIGNPAGVLPRRGSGRWDQQQQQGGWTSEVGSASVSSGLSSHRRFNDSEVTREGPSPAGFPVYESGFDNSANPTPRHASTLLNSQGSSRTRIQSSATPPLSASGDIGSDSAAGLPSATFTKAPPPPGFSVPCKLVPSLGPGAGGADPPLSSAAVAAVDGSRDWLRLHGGGGGGGSWQGGGGGGVVVGNGADISVGAAGSGSGSGGENMELSWAARQGNDGSGAAGTSAIAGSCGMRICDQGERFMADVQVEQQLLWDVTGGGGGAGDSGRGAHQSSWLSTVLPPRRREGEGTWGP